MSKHEHVCPWWMGYLLVSPLRKLLHCPRRILEPLVKPGMRVLEPGPGMGFFTLELARLVGDSGRVVAVDIQEKMLAVLKKRLERRGLGGRVESRLCPAAGLGVSDLAGQVDFVLAFAMVHELPDAAGFFREAAAALKPGGRMLFAEPVKHVNEEEFQASVCTAGAAGLVPGERLSIWGTRAIVLIR